MTLEEAQSKKIIIWFDVETFLINPENTDLIEWINQELNGDDIQDQVFQLTKEYRENKNADQ